MKPSLRNLPPIGLGALTGVLLGGCSINGAIREGDRDAIRYGKELELVVRKYVAAGNGSGDLRSLIDPDYYYDPDVSLDAPDRPLEDLRRIRDERVDIEKRFQEFLEGIHAAVIQLDKTTPPAELRKFHDALRAKLVAESEVWLEVPQVLDQILEDLSFKPGRSLVEKDAAVRYSNTPELASLIPKELIYRNPWLSAASRLEVHVPEDWWNSLVNSLLIAFMGFGVAVGLLYLAADAISRTPLAKWQIVIANFLAVSVGAGCIGAGAAGLSIDLSEPGYASPRWFPALVLFVGLLFWTGWALAGRDNLPSLLDQSKLEPTEHEQADYGPMLSDSFVVVGYLCGLSVCFVVFFWAYFAPHGLPQPWAWFYER